MSTSTNPVEGSAPISLDQAASLLLSREAPPPEDKPTEAATSISDETQPADQPSGDIEDAATGDQQATDEPATQPTQPEQPTFSVRVDGTEQKVTLDELLNGYQRTADYTKKTQAIAEQRKQAEAELAAARVERQRYAETLRQLEAQLAQTQPEPDWNKLYAEDPLEYVRQKDAWRDRRERAQALQGEQARLAQLQQVEQRALLEQHLAVERQRLVEAIPQWRDEQTAAKEREAIVTWAKRAGFSDQEIAQSYDHRAVNVLRKAMLYDELMGKNLADKQTPKPAPAMARPGMPPSKNETSSKARREALSRLSKSGRIEDAVDFLMQR
jgi:hypothetical protein